ncbi:hypothetical protein [Rhodococcus sp. IEGM 1406]|uniref:hypothetical protein n=1 Tax=Rhodococcus sp. IEGM 1406 TaxID=3047083 RepID=UPI0024B7A30F|nr:hypothetical protein [Rhodococcus sp. IEGM 1406]MDI9905616.1 hypothetical protein [Rhodococcus sp. IEGM 1406]
MTPPSYRQGEATALGMSTSVKRQQPSRRVQNRTNVFFLMDTAAKSLQFEHSRHLHDEAARALGVYPSQMLQWTRISRSPTPQVLRRVAALFDAPVQEVLIAAGFMTEEENVPLSPTRMSLQQLSNKQILDEIRRRTAGDLAGPPIPVRVNGVIRFPDGPPTVFVENT